MKKFIILLFVLSTINSFAQIQKGDKSLGGQMSILKSGQITMGILAPSFGKALTNHLEISVEMPLTIAAVTIEKTELVRKSKTISGYTIYYDSAVYSSENQIMSGFMINIGMNYYFTTKSKAVPFLLSGIGFGIPSATKGMYSSAGSFYFGGGIRYFLSRNFSWKSDMSINTSGGITEITSGFIKKQYSYSRTWFNIKTGFVYTF